MGADALYAVGFYCICPVFLSGRMGSEHEQREEFWRLVFGFDAMEYFNYVVGLVCFRCWGDCHVDFEFFVDVYPICYNSMVAEKKAISMGRKMAIYCALVDL